MEHFENIVYRQQFEVKYGTPVIFTKNAFSRKSTVLTDILKSKRYKKLFVVVDKGVVEKHADLKQKIRNYCQHHGLNLSSVLVLEGGEQAKNAMKTVMKIIDEMEMNGLCRHSFVIAIGGGALLDATGFAASIFHRGIPLIRFPSTALSQCDSGVGVKNGINYHGVKNMIGAFASPFAVINDMELYRTTTVPSILDGIAEAVKVFVIKNKQLFNYVEESVDSIRNMYFPVIDQIIKDSALLHSEHIQTSGDPFENGTSRPLDFGHWSAHKIESMSDCRVSHGSAVALGILLDSFYAWKTGYIDQHTFQRIFNVIQGVGLNTWHPLLEKKGDDGQLEILNGLEDFRQHLGGELTIALPTGIGSFMEVHSIDTDVIASGIRYLKEL